MEHDLGFPPFLETDKAGLTSHGQRHDVAGTETRTKAQIAEDVEFLGATFFGQCQGLLCKLAEQAHRRLLRIVSDAILNPTFPEEELEKVKKQVVLDWRTSPPIRVKLRATSFLPPTLEACTPTVRS